MSIGDWFGLLFFVVLGIWALVALINYETPKMREEREECEREREQIALGNWRFLHDPGVGCFRAVRRSDGTWSEYRRYPDSW